MVKQTIQIFGRVKPTKAKTGVFEITEDPDTPLISFTVPKEQSEGFINNKKELYKFKFEKIFGQNIKQDEIFDNVAKPVIDNVLKGYNGTIFAYGQTGSGKTFTITGGAERYIDRGIIPRTLSYIFDYHDKNTDQSFSTHISYLEIYNESGYDLLDPKHEAAKLEDLPKVHLMEDADQNIHLKNLSAHQANSEEEAVNLLFLGDTNRMIAETPMNQASTRSHCIFTIHVTSREPGSATVRRSKLHLVDLAGSERVGKTGVNGVQLTEAKYINLSLHYLEQVIVALAEKSRQHIPYRNSMMTSVLRDSLGGNCMTTMIATMSVEKKNVDESISTCRFAQRVALIKNDAILNEELDPKLMIARLKRDVQQLKEELAMATGEQRTDALSEEDLERCQEAVQQYLEDSDPEATLDIGCDMRKIQECYRILKKKVSRGSSAQSSPSTARDTLSQSSPPQTGNPAEEQRLKGLIVQRDNEINILVNMLKKEKQRAAMATSELQRQGLQLPQVSTRGTGEYVSQNPQVDASANFNAVFTNDNVSESSTQSRSMSASINGRQSANDRPPSSHRSRTAEKQRQRKENEEQNKKKILGDMSMGRQEAFEIFRRDYEHNSAIDDNKLMLKQRYTEAKTLGETVNVTRAKINKLRSSIEQHRMSLVMKGLVDSDNPEPDELELEMRVKIEEEKARYKQAFNRLRSLKTEIEHLQHLLEKSKVKLMKDFELWWAEEAAAAQAKQEQLRGLPPGKSKAAWRTPPVTPNNNKGLSQPSAASSQTSLLSDVSSQARSDMGSDQRLPRLPHDVSGLRSASDTSGYGSRESLHSTQRRPNPITSSRGVKPDSTGIQLTGDTQADADIMAFLKARQKILKHSQDDGR